MGDKTPDLEEAIQLALEAATAANDSASEVDRLSSDTREAADRIDKLANGLRPALYGVLGGTVIAIALGGLVYMRTLSEMRSATAAHVEALSQYSQTVTDLTAALEKTEALATQVTAMSDAQTEGFAGLRQALRGSVEDDTATGSDPAMTTIPRSGGDACNLASQMIQALPQKIEDHHRATRDAVTMSISDLQLAMSRMLANRPGPTAADAPPTATRPTPRPAASPAKATPRKKPSQASRAKPAPNPFSYP